MDNIKKSFETMLTSIDNIISEIDELINEDENSIEFLKQRDKSCVAINAALGEEKPSE